MKAFKLIAPALSILFLSSATQAGEEVDRLLKEYSQIKTVTCQIRRTKEGELGKMRFLSRVYWTDKGQLHAEGISPIKRRTIADGKTLYQYVNGDPKGFSRPIEDLSEQMRISLEMVPGTAMDHLLRLKETDESVLPVGENGEKRIGIQTDEKYVVLQLDAQNRLESIGFYKTSALKDRIALYEYRDFAEAAPGVWAPLTHQVSVQNDTGSYKETVKVDRFIANKPVAESLFISTSFFDKDIDFVDDFAKIFPE